MIVCIVGIFSLIRRAEVCKGKTLTRKTDGLGCAVGIVFILGTAPARTKSSGQRNLLLGTGTKYR